MRMRVLKLLLNLMPRDKFIASYADVCIETSTSRLLQA